MCVMEIVEDEDGQLLVTFAVLVLAQKEPRWRSDNQPQSLIALASCTPSTLNSRRVLHDAIRQY